MTDIPQCKLCTAPMFQTASGAWVCPICDRIIQQAWGGPNVSASTGTHDPHNTQTL